ncbi:uncharacterized protein [Gossypium hirsutum]|uniref:Retrotransposon Copia-like N-terminal domain-containing protein n=1 Tax=Gossypium hirsutum TaxID=3635 RepID=A0A1U8NVI7_GOSHI|nr:uncharacterized protein LOC107952238 [Gossypium hirsutum]
MAPTLLLNIFTKNKLNGNNYNEWKRNLIIALSCEKLKTVLDTKCPPAIQVEARKCWEESNELTCCYMLASMTNTLYKQLESCKTTKAIQGKLEDMFGSQAALEVLAIGPNVREAQKPLMDMKGVETLVEILGCAVHP